MQIGLITDTHFSFKKSNKIFHQYFKQFYDEIFFPTLEDLQIQSIIHLGDAFDNRKGVDYWGLEWAQRVVYDRLQDMNIEVYQIGGNHDCSYKDTNKINAIDTLLRDYDNVIKITEPKEMIIGNTASVMVPWICKENEERTFNLLENSQARVVFGHLELTGFTLFPGQVQNHGMSVEKFKKFDRVFSGHYHTRSTDGKVFYLGNPYQMFWSDVDDVRGFHIFDTETYELKFIKNPYNIFERIYYSDTVDTDFDFSIVENKIVKVVVKERNNQIKYDKFISEILKKNIIDLKVVEIIDINQNKVDLTEDDGEDTLSTLDKYLEKVEINLDKTMIKKILHDTYKEALELEMS